MGMVGVELQVQVGGGNLVKDVGGKVEIRKVMAGHIAAVDRLDRQAAPGSVGGGPFKIGDKGGPRLGLVGGAGHDVKMQGVQHLGKAQAAVEIAAKAVLSPRDRGKALRAAGGVRRRAVHQNKGQSVPDQLIAHVLRRAVIGEKHLDRVKACSFRGLKPVHERQFGEQPAEVGGKARHQGSSADGMIGKNRPADHRPNQLSP